MALISASCSFIAGTGLPDVCACYRAANNMHKINIVPILIALTYLSCQTSFINTAVIQKNVLFIISDDLRPQLGSYFGTEDFPDPYALKPVTPNLDKLAGKSLLLRRAYVQISICGPSRTSFLTGRRPDTTKLYENNMYVRTPEINLTTIPQYFKEHGYNTIGIGKIFHGRKEGEFFDPISWTHPNFNFKLKPETDDTWWAMSRSDKKEYTPHDDKVIRLARRTLETISQEQGNESKPFFMAVGFWKPHLRFACPKEFFKLYPRETITLPKYQFVPPEMPRYEWNTCNNINSRQIDERFDFNVTFADEEVVSLRQAYYACVSYVDSLVGNLLETLEDVGLHRNTIVSFIGDHGWFLGENNMWCKRTNLDLGTHTPMMIHIPNVTDHGVTTTKLVEFVDLFPTLVEAAGLPLLPLCPETNDTHPNPIPTCREGTSLIPLIEDPNLRSWKKYAFSQFKPKDNIFSNPKQEMVMGYSIRQKSFRYIEWFKHKTLTKETFLDQSRGKELYFHGKDSGDNKNLAYDEKYSKIVEKLGQVIRDGWRKAHKMKE